MTSNMNAPPRILLAVESFVPKASGIGRVARLMAKFLEERRAAGVIDPRGLALNDPAVEEWLWVRSSSGSRLHYVLGVQVQGSRSRAMFFDSLSMARARGFGPARLRPALSWMHGIEVWEGARKVHLAAARASTILVTNSAYTRRRAASLHPDLARARVCWLGTESDDPPPELPSRPHPPTALILSRLDPSSYKGHRELIEVWEEVTRRVPGARLLIAGDGPGREEIERWARASPASSGIVFTGFVPEAKLEELWMDADLLAMPSRGEGFGLVYIEAMRHGLPVIASRQDAGQEINRHGESGLNVDLDRPQELVEALVGLLSNPERSRMLGGRGRRLWYDHFRWSAFRDRFTRLLEETALLGHGERTCS